ncbi:MAG: Crp/Fnr family transcriptional regulator [Chitinophagaceae bacterium]|nr:MAG: Crp/Fnr family transcriptional regulator [Chitinophagaceae bacterium]
MEEMLRRHIDEVVRLSDEEYDFVRQRFSIQYCKKGGLLINKNQQVLYVYLVISGLLKLVYHDKTGREHIVSFAMEEWWESDYAAWFSRQPASLSLKCIEDTQVYCLTLENYEIICAGLHKMEHFFLHKANRGHMASQDRILSFLTATPRERYELVLNKQPALMQRLPKAMLAAYLGLSRETISRLWRNK